MKYINYTFKPNVKQLSTARNLALPRVFRIIVTGVIVYTVTDAELR